MSPKEVVVCTTKEASDDTLVAAATALGVSVYRGSTDDLIRRLSDTVEALDLDILVEADGDDLFCATEYMDLCFETMLADPEMEIVTCKELPLGIAPRGFTRSAMRKVMKSYVSAQNDTGFFHLFTHTGLCREKSLFPASDAHRHTGARLTLDYLEDLEFFRRLAGDLGAPGKPASLSEVVARLDANPELVAINRHMTAEYRKRQKARINLQYRDAEGKVRGIAV